MPSASGCWSPCITIFSKMPAGASREQRPSCFKALHRTVQAGDASGNQDHAGIRLVSAKGGLKMQAVTPTRIPPARTADHWEGKGLSMAALVDFLRGQVGPAGHRPDGHRRKVHLPSTSRRKSASRARPLLPIPRRQDSNAPSLFTRSPRRLGLRLTSAKVPVCDPVVTTHREKCPRRTKRLTINRSSGWQQSCEARIMSG